MKLPGFSVNKKSTENTIYLERKMEENVYGKLGWHLIKAEIISKISSSRISLGKSALTESGAPFIFCVSLIASSVKQSGIFLGQENPIIKCCRNKGCFFRLSSRLRGPGAGDWRPGKSAAWASWAKPG